MIVATGDLRLAERGLVATGEGPVEQSRWNTRRFYAHFLGDESGQYIFKKLLSNGIPKLNQLASLAITRAKSSPACGGAADPRAWWILLSRTGACRHCCSTMLPAETARVDKPNPAVRPSEYRRVAVVYVPWSAGTAGRVTQGVGAVHLP